MLHVDLAATYPAVCCAVLQSINAAAKEEVFSVVSTLLGNVKVVTPNLPITTLPTCNSAVWRGNANEIQGLDALRVMYVFQGCHTESTLVQTCP